VQLEVEVHNREVRAAEVEEAAAGASAALPPGVAAKSARALRRYIFGPSHGSRKPFKAQVAYLYDQKKFLVGQLEGAQF
jgi:hypothetical protein